MYFPRKTLERLNKQIHSQYDLLIIFFCYLLCSKATFSSVNSLFIFFQNPLKNSHFITLQMAFYEFTQFMPHLQGLIGHS